MKSPEPGNKVERKIEYKNYDAITMSRNYGEKLLQEIITEQYELVYQSRRKCEIYRDTGVSSTSHKKNSVTLGFRLNYF